MEVATEGVEATLIDFTLSRLSTPSGDVRYCDLAADPALFQQPKGDCQVRPLRHMCLLHIILQKQTNQAAAMTSMEAKMLSNAPTSPQKHMGP